MKNKYLRHLISIARRYLLLFLLPLTAAMADDLKQQSARSIQEIKLDIDVANANLKEVFNYIESKTGLSFTFDENEIRIPNKFTFNQKNLSVEEILRTVSTESGLSFRQVNQTISVYRHNSSLQKKPSIEIIIQTRKVTGRVTSNKDSEPLPGVNVVEKGTSNGTVTDVDGNYTLNVAQGAVLIFSSVGYLTQEIQSGNLSVIDLKLVDDIQQLEEIVVVGYGTMRRKDVTGSVSSITSSDLVEKPVTNFVQALQGRASGMTVISSNGEPGSDMIIRIRGGNSLKNDNKPLIVIDGIPTDVDLSSLAPSDIMSIDILKDASSTAIYGSRGANGVMMITTNRGQVGKPVVNFSTYQGFDRVRKMLPVLNGLEYALLSNERQIISGLEPEYSEQFLRDSTAGTDWQDELFRTAPVNNYQLSVSGGNQDVKYFTSLGYFDQDGIVINSNFRRYTLRMNLDAYIGKNLKIMPSIDLGRTISNSNSRNASVVYNSLLANPLDIPTPDGEYYYDPITGEQTRDVTPVKLAMERINQRNFNYTNVSLPMYYDITPNLTLMARFGANVSQTLRNRYIPLEIVDNPSETSASIENSQATAWINENTLTYAKEFGKHSLNLLGGVTFEESTWEGNVNRASGFENDNLIYHNLSAATILLQPSSSAGRTALVSGLFRVNYSFNDKYLITATGRADGSSKFGADHKWGIFPSMAVGWQLGDEDFVKSLGLFDNLKLRASYGVTGNQNFGAYSSLDLRGDAKTVFGNALYAATYPSIMPNSRLSWETTTQLDAGFDATILNKRLSMVVDYYEKTTNRLMLDKQVPYYTGFTSVVDNVGKLENKGVEVTLEGTVLNGEFKWYSSLNASYNKNKVLSLANDAEMITGEFEASGNYAGIANNMIIVGQPVGTFYGFKTNGVYQWGENFSTAPKQPNGMDSQPGDVRYVDVSGPEGTPDGLITDDDRVVLGSALPKWSGGFSNTFSYKNFDLTIFANSFYGNKIFNMSLFRLYSMTDDWNSLSIVKDRWLPPTLDGNGNPVPGTGNPSNKVPRLLKANEGQYIHVHDRFIEDGSFLRIRNITLGYNLPESLLKRLKIQQLRIYGDLQNYFTWTDYMGYDPEVSDFGDNNRGLGIDKYTFPMSKSWVMGVQLRF